MRHDNCLGLALKTAKKEYVRFVTIIPICFILIESLHVFSKIHENSISFETIKTLRIIVSCISAAAFFWLTLGGIQEYIKKDGKDVRVIWWIVQGIEETFLFSLLAIYQHIDYDPGNIISSFWFWAGLTVFVCIIVWFILSKGKPVIPEQKWMWWIKTFLLVWISIWAGYKPADKDFDAATIVILLMTGIITFYCFSIAKLYTYIIGFILTFGLPAAILITSIFTKENKTVEWVYFVLLVVTGLLYLSIVIMESISTDEIKLPPI
jgi:hypothetical protein